MRISRSVSLNRVYRVHVWWILTDCFRLYARGIGLEQQMPAVIRNTVEEPITPPALWDSFS